jgi:mannose-6-phosphate isomerase-like protein (cupin superfamily)
MSADRFILLADGQNRPTRVPLPPGFGVKASTADTQGRLAVIENQLNVDVPEHVHTQMDELIYVLEGELEISFEGTTHRLTAGMFVLLPMGVPHALRNVSQPPARTLQISSPGGWDEFISDMFEAGPALRTADGRMDLAKLNKIGASYGMRYTNTTMDIPQP